MSILIASYLFGIRTLTISKAVLDAYHTGVLNLIVHNSLILLAYPPRMSNGALLPMIPLIDSELGRHLVDIVWTEGERNA
jgi:hypothetical protein